MLTTVLIISIILLIVGVIGALANLSRGFPSLGSNRLFSKGMFQRHFLFVALGFVGGLGTFISGIALIVQAFAK